MPEPTTQPVVDQPPQGGRSFRIDEILSAISMALICAISLGNVVVRYATDASFAFTEEFSIFLLVFMTLIGTAAAIANDGHIRITFLRDLLPPRHRRLADAVALLCSALLFLWSYYGGVFAYENGCTRETSPGMGLPNWIYTVWLPLLSALILVRIGGRLVRLFRCGGC